MNKRGQYILIAVLAAIFVINLVLVFCLDAMKPAKTPTEIPTETTTAPTEEPTEPPTEAPTQAPTEPPVENFVLTFTGDSTLGSKEGGWDDGDSFISIIGTDYDHPYRNLKDIFAADDCTFTNLEGVFAEDGVGKPQDKLFCFRGPLEYTQILTGSSVEVVSLANNHSKDYGQEGLNSTKKVLDEAGVKYAEHQSSVLFTTESGLKIGMYAISFTMDEADLREEVAQLREDGAEIVILALHRGDEGIYRPNDQQIHIAHTAIDAGVDIVWGHNPHVLQSIEEYNGGIILYSLGNLSFGGNRNPKDRDTAVIQQQVIREKDGTIHLGELTVIPCCLSSVPTHNNFQPTPYEKGSAEYDRVISKLDGTFDGEDIPPDYATAPTEEPATEASIEATTE